MDIKALRESDVSKLKDELLALRREQFNVRMQLSSGQSKNTARNKGVRRDIARVKTVLRELKDKA